MQRVIFARGVFLILIFDNLLLSTIYHYIGELSIAILKIIENVFLDIGKEGIL